MYTNPFLAQLVFFLLSLPSLPCLLSLPPFSRVFFSSLPPSSSFLLPCHSILKCPFWRGGFVDLLVWVKFSSDELSQYHGICTAAFEWVSDIVCVCVCVCMLMHTNLMDLVVCKCHKERNRSLGVCHAADTAPSTWQCRGPGWIRGR